MSYLRANLKLFQTLEDDQNDIPVASRISNNSCVMVSAHKSGIIHVYTRPCYTAQFNRSEGSYMKHQEKKSTVKALALQDGGAQAVSGDDHGNLHVWLTAEPSKSTSRQCGYGPVVDVAISQHFILASFNGTTEKDPCMVLINKGLNIKDDWEIVKVYEPGKYSKCALSEKLKLKELNVIYYLDKKLVYEKNPHEIDNPPFDVLGTTKPFFVCHNPACLTTLVFAALVQQHLMLWDPKHPVADGKNPFFFKLRSSDPIALNKTSSTSSVCDGRIFIVTIFRNKLSVVTLEKEGERTAKKSATTAGEDNLTKHTVFHAVKELVSGNPEPVDRIVAEVEDKGAKELMSNSRTAIIGEHPEENITETPSNSANDNGSGTSGDDTAAPMSLSSERNATAAESPNKSADVEPGDDAESNAGSEASGAEAKDILPLSDPGNDEIHDDSVVVTDGEESEEVVEDPEGMAHEFWGLF